MALSVFSLIDAIRMITEPDNGLTAYERLVMVSLVRHSDKLAECYPGQNLIADECAISERTVRNAIKGLGDKKWIEIHAQKGRVHKYIITLPRQEMPHPRQEMPESSDETPAQDAAPPAGDAGTPARGADEVSHLSIPSKDSDKNNLVSVAKDEVAAAEDQQDEPDDVQKVYEHYRATFGDVFSRISLTQLRREKIKTRLNECSADDLCKAITAIRASPWHCGENPNGTRYATLEWIMHNRERVEKWINQAEGGSNNANGQRTSSTGRRMVQTSERPTTEHYTSDKYSYLFASAEPDGLS